MAKSPTPKQTPKPKPKPKPKSTWRGRPIGGKGSKTGGGRGTGR